MTDLDRPPTRRELREELEAFATRKDMNARFDEFRDHFDKEMNTRVGELRDHFDKEMNTRVGELRDHFDKEMNVRFDELRVHFDVVAESFKSHFDNLYDWVLTNTKILAERVKDVEVRHGGRLESLETRIMRLNKPGK